MFLFQITMSERYDPQLFGKQAKPADIDTVTKKTVPSPQHMVGGCNTRDIANIFSSEHFYHSEK